MAAPAKGPRMKRSEFKALVKECVRECMREILQEQVMPVGMPQVQEALFRPAPVPAASSVAQMPAVFNPMDDSQMRLRQDLLLQQRGLMQSQLQRQQASASGAGQLASAVGPAASMPVADPFDQSGGQRLSAAGGQTGYVGPADRLRMAGESRRTFDPSLDVPLAGSARQPQRRQAQAMPMPQAAMPAGNEGRSAPIDPGLMRQLFEDTANTTYRMQASVGHSRAGHTSGGGGGEGFVPPVDKFAEVVSNSSPEDLFPGAGNWGALAFRS